MLTNERSLLAIFFFFSLAFLFFEMAKRKRKKDSLFSL